MKERAREREGSRKSGFGVDMIDREMGQNCKRDPEVVDEKWKGKKAGIRWKSKGRFGKRSRYDSKRAAVNVQRSQKTAKM